MWVRSLSREDPLEEGLATHSSILAWRIPWSEEPGGLRSMGLQRVRTYTSLITFMVYPPPSAVPSLPCEASILLSELSQQPPH